MGDAVADDAGVLGGDECFVLGVGALGAGAEELEELVAAPVGGVDQLVGRDRLAERVRERREQPAVLRLNGVLGQDGGVLELGGISVRFVGITFLPWKGEPMVFVAAS